MNVGAVSSRVRRLGVARAVVCDRIVEGDVGVLGDQISAVGLSPAGHGTAVPGFVDLQVNGYGGVDFLTDADDDAWLTAGERLLASGVTGFQPTLITAAPAAVEAGLARAARLRDRPARGARVIGAHVEGPFIAPTRLGTHPAEHRRDPDRALLERFLGSGAMTMMTLAPELDGALELVDDLVAAEVVASVGHSDATAADAHAAFDRGAAAATHLFNAMGPIAAREPGVAGVALARPDVTAMCIVDGVHLADETVSLLLAAGDSLALTSDAIAAAGIGDGDFRLGPVAVEVRDGRAINADGALAGGVGSVCDAVRRLVSLGAPLPRAVAAATTVPARLVGRDDLGSLRPGARADIVVLDEDLTVERVVFDGKGVEAA